MMKNAFETLACSCVDGILAKEELDEIIKPENMIKPKNFSLAEKNKKH